MHGIEVKCSIIYVYNYIYIVYIHGGWGLHIGFRPRPQNVRNGPGSASAHHPDFIGALSATILRCSRPFYPLGEASVTLTFSLAISYL
jgi:hypothetical protein